MRLVRGRLHLRIPRPRWPSKDYRDYQSVGRLQARRLRRTETTTGVSRPGGAELSGLIRVVGIHREQALLHVELLAPPGVTLDRRAALRLPESSGEPCSLAQVQASPEPAIGGTWTARLTLN